MNTGSGLQELYSDKDMTILKNYIKKHYGKSQSLYRDYSSEGVHPDIAIIPPKFSKPFFTLVTVGMGAHKTVPPTESQAHFEERTELILTLNKDWLLEEKTEEWYWPLHMLRDAAKTTADNNSPIGNLHTIEMPKFYDPFNKFCGALLVEPEVDISDDVEQCELTDGSTVKFLQFIPLFREELRFKKDHGGEKLLKAIKDKAVLDPVYSVDPERHSAI